jgi:Family of unknown function (DUF5985)
MTIRWAGSAFEGMVYILCVLTSVACAYFLLRAYLRTRTRLLAWSSVCFWLFALNNLCLAIDVLLLPDNDLSIIRTFTSLLAVSVLLVGFIWEV